ncbi:MAG: hypothetical protein ACXAEB_10445 [Candidatus Thorarchaeota archaeon]
MNEQILRVYIESSSMTIQPADMETIGHPQCTNTRSPADKLGAGDRYLPQDQRLLLDAVGRVAEKLNFEVEVIDVSQYALLKRLRSKGIIPRLEVGDLVLEGIPTSDEIIQSISESKAVLH